MNDLSPEIKITLEPLVAEFSALHGENLRCLALYGSAAEGNFIKGKSNINTIAVFKDLQFDTLKKSAPLVAKNMKKGILAPVMVTQAHLAASTDVFPVEYLGMREAHVVLHGEDLLKDLKISKEDLKRECEEMIKGLSVRLRSSYLEAAADEEALGRLLREAVPALMPVFRSLVFSKGVAYPRSHEQTVIQAGMVLGFDDHLLGQLLAARRGEKSILGSEIVLAHLLDELSALAEAVDTGEKINRR